MGDLTARDLFGPPPPPPSYALQAASKHYPYCTTCRGYRPARHDHTILTPRKALS